MNIYTIFKREKPAEMPTPNFADNWKQERYEKNVKEGVLLLQQGKQISIMDDGRGYELALDIKRQFILEYQKQLAESIEIKSGSVISIKVNPK